ncbi:hypothetical protein J7T55_000197 [Diaporthe amygdali]|uniref:uncharacterized protein n=1 Tax=Phomopsis amygdali TaxID=1214568 RepID=UPI0022FDD943|nr:uncharacterized protein J7T55_000197 [Diaporthe amygdali]KAJ0108232.1 hypothetical protein J7T55_000197 [Diaporthe amygdali]
MREDRKSKGGLKERIKHLVGRDTEGHEEIPSSSSSAGDLALPESATAQSNLSAQAEPGASSSSGQTEQVKQNSSLICLWEQAVARLDQEDAKKAKKLLKSSQKRPAHSVAFTLEMAGKLKNEDKESSTRSVADKIIQGALAFKAIGDAAVKFDKSGYAALGWSVVSFGLQVAANVKEAREFVLSSSEVITRSMAKYREYELVIRGLETGKGFDEQLINVYKAVLLYMIALDNYLHQPRLGHIASAALKLQERSINSTKKAIDAADAEISHWLLVIAQKRNDDNFSRILGLLKDRLPHVPEWPGECLKSLSFLGMEDRYNDIDHAAEGTCKWLLGHEAYRDWTNIDCGMLCIKGKPGSGKSTLLRYAVRDAVMSSNIRDRSLLLQNKTTHESGNTAVALAERGALILSFFFHDRGEELQKNTLGLYLSLLHQTLRHVPRAMPDDLLAQFEKRTNNMGNPGVKWNWHEKELRNYFRLSLLKALEDRPVCLFIDAMDEYGKDNANELIESFKLWIKECPSRSQLRICFICRHHPRLALPQKRTEICLENENKTDILEYVRLRLSTLPPSKDLDAIQTDIVNRASGVFMWARLVVKKVLNLESDGYNWEMIKDQVNKAPELNELYKSLMEKVADKSSSFKLIQWICFAKRPLTLNELRWAMVIEPDLSYSPNSLRHYEKTKHFATDCDMMEKKLTMLSCGLAEAVTSTGAVQFIHQSVKDFFIEEGLADLKKSLKPATPETNGEDLVTIAHYLLSRTCIRYVSTKEVMETMFRGSELMSEFPLLHYAVTNWEAHVRESEKPNTPNDLLSYFDWPSEVIVTRYRDTFDSLRLEGLIKVGISQFPRYLEQGVTLLHVASFNRFMRPLQDMMERKELLEGGIDPLTGYCGPKYTPLFVAAEQGHEDVVRLLLENGASADATVNDDGNIPLKIASSRGHLSIVRMLIQHNANVNGGDAYSNALSEASRMGHDEIVRMLLDNGADVDATQGLGRGSALQGAEHFGHEKIIRMLLDASMGLSEGYGQDQCSENKGLLV